MQLDLPFHQSDAARIGWSVLRFVGRTIKALWEGGVWAATVIGIAVITFAFLFQFTQRQLCSKEFYVHRSVPWQERDIRWADEIGSPKAQPANL